MRRKHPKSHYEGSVSLTVGGREYTAAWSVSGGKITVRHAEFGEKWAILRNAGTGGEEILARMLLGEMIPADEWRK